MKFKKQDLQDMAYDEDGPLRKITSRVTDTSRWSINYEVIFRDDATGKHYKSFYSVGATEQQGEEAYEYADEEEECFEVELKKVITEVWEEIA